MEGAPHHPSSLENKSKNESGWHSLIILYKIFAISKRRLKEKKKKKKKRWKGNTYVAIFECRKGVENVGEWRREKERGGTRKKFAELVYLFSFG